MDKKVQLIGGVIIVAAVVLVLGVIYFKKSGDRPAAANLNITAQNQPLEPVEQKELKQEYEKGAQAIVASVIKGRRGSVAQAELLALVVPSEYKDLHLDLVIALSLVEQGQSGSLQEKIEEGLEKIENLKQQYPWLAE